MNPFYNTWNCDYIRQQAMAEFCAVITAYCNKRNRG